MQFKKMTRISIAAIAAVLSIAATENWNTTDNWNTTVVRTDRAMQIGKEDAPVTLTEFVSYSCKYCASFFKESEALMQIGFVGSGKVRREIRSIINSPVDLTVTMLVQCGDDSKFLQNHAMFISQQQTWLDKSSNSTTAQRAKWSQRDAASRRSMSSALGFYAMMETRGYSRTQIDSCLDDDVKVAALLANTQADFAEFNIPGTPSFAINGETASGVHTWQVLGPILESKFQ